MSKKENQEEGGKLLNKQTDNPFFQIDRGFELQLRDKKRRVKPKTFQLKFGKLLTLFKREFHFNIDLSFDIKKTS